MADQERTDPFAEVINLLAAPIASGIRSYEQFRRGIEEMFRTIDNLNTTMENLNEAASRLNRLMADVEEPIRTMIPQLSRTVKAADEMIEVVSGPAMKVAPSLVRISDTLGSPAFTRLPDQLTEFLNVMGEMSRRMGPLTQFAESAGSLFGLRMPVAAPAKPPAPEPPPPAHAPAPTPPPAKKAAAKKYAAKKSAAKKSVAKKATAKKTAAAKRAATN